jgi:hypothetical protein
MKEFIEFEAKKLVDDIREIAESCGAPEKASLDQASAYIWERGDTKDIAEAAHSGGQLAMLARLSKVYMIHVSEKTEEEFKWQSVIEPS